MNKFDITDKFLKDSIKKVSEEHLNKYLVFRILVNDPNEIVKTFRSMTNTLNDKSKTLEEKLRNIENVYLGFIQCVGIGFDKKEAEEIVQNISDIYEPELKDINDKNIKPQRICPSFLITKFDQTVPINLISKNVFNKLDKKQFESSKRFTELIEEVDDELIKKQIAERTKTAKLKMNYEKGTVDHYFALSKIKQSIDMSYRSQLKMIEEQKKESERLDEEIKQLLIDNPEIIKKKVEILNGSK